MNWTDSNTIRGVAVAWIISVLGTLVPMLQAHKIDLWALGAESVAALAVILVRMSQADVVAPGILGFLNRKAPKL